MIQRMHPFMIFLRDLALHAKGLLCIIRRRHDSLEPIGNIVKKGFGPVPLFQCRRCAMFWIRESGARKLGGRRA